MASHVKKTVWVLTALVALAVLSACGGGGGATIAVADPAPAYKGVNSQAKIKEDNAHDLALGGYAGGSLGAALGWRSMAKAPDAPAPVEPTLPQLTSALKTSLLQVMASNTKRSQTEPSRGKVLSRAESFNVPGWFGGYASYEMEMNDDTGSFSGTVRYTDFATGSYTFSGDAAISGTFDPAQQAIQLLVLSMKSLKVTGGYTLDLTGEISWTFDLSVPADTMDMNMVLLDQSSGKTFWFKDYTVKSLYGYASMTQDLSGRYFDPDHGFVNFKTDEPIIADYLSTYPVQGAITFSGSGRTSVLLRFQPDRITIAADVDGDGNADLQDVILQYAVESGAASFESGFVMTTDPAIPDTPDTPENQGSIDSGGNGNGSNDVADEPPPMPDDNGPPDMDTPQQGQGSRP